MDDDGTDDKTDGRIEDDGGDADGTDGRAKLINTICSFSVFV